MDSARKRDEECAPEEVWRHIRMLTWLRRNQIFQLIKTTFTAWSDDNVPRLGASLAFYTALSLAPLIVVVLAMASLAFGKQAAQGQLVWEIQNLVGKQGAQAIQTLIQASHRASSGIIATLLGLITLFFGATSVVVELTGALNTIWHVPPDPSNTGFRSILRLVRDRFLSFAMVLGVGFLLLVSLFVSAWLSAVEGYFRTVLPFSTLVLEITNFLLSFFVITILFAVIYKVLPSVYLKWSDVAIGAAATSLLFTLGKFLIALYLGRTSFGSTYGAAGSFVVVLVWVYYSAQVFFLGAEFTRVYALEFGSRFESTLKVTPEKLETNLIIDPSSVSRS